MFWSLLAQCMKEPKRKECLIRFSFLLFFPFLFFLGSPHLRRTFFLYPKEEAGAC